MDNVQEIVPEYNKCCCCGKMDNVVIKKGVFICMECSEKIEKAAKKDAEQIAKLWGWI